MAYTNGANKEFATTSNQDYLIFFDDIRVDQYVQNWTATISVSGSYGSASISMYYVPDMDKITHDFNKENVLKYTLETAYTEEERSHFFIDDGVENMTNVRIFMKNIYSGRFVQVFEGNIRAKSISVQSGRRTITFEAYDYMNWMNRIICPWSIAINDSYASYDLINWAAYGIDAVVACNQYKTVNETDGNGMSLAQAINRVIHYSYLNNAFLSEANSVMAWDKPLLRLILMGDISETLRTAKFWGYMIETQSTQTDSFYLKMQSILNNLMFEYYQDRDGLIRIKPAFWNRHVMKNSIVDSSMIVSFFEQVNWNNFYTRVVCNGGVNQENSTITSSDAVKYLTPTAVATFAGQVITQKVSTYSGTKSNTGDDTTKNKIVTFSQGESVLSTSGYLWPVPGHLGVDLEFGKNTSSNKLNTGIDITCATKSSVSIRGANVVAAKNGTVTFVHDCNHTGACAYKNGLGSCVFIEHSDGNITKYCNLGSVLVKKNAEVTMGDIIGKVGSSGNVNTATLHFEIESKDNSTVDPMIYLSYDTDGAEEYDLVDILNGDGSLSKTAAQTISYESDPDLADQFLLTLSAMEKRYGPLVRSMTQSMIKFENAAALLGGSTTSDFLTRAYEKDAEEGVNTTRTQACEALCKYSQFYLNYLNATCDVASLTTIPMPWMRPGTNLWIDPAGIDKIFYINSITHSGGMSSGCSSSFSLSIGRSRQNFLNGSVMFGSAKTASEDVFVNTIYEKTLKGSFDNTLKESDYAAIRTEFRNYHLSNSKKEETAAKREVTAAVSSNSLMYQYCVNTDTTIKNYAVSFEATGEFVKPTVTVSGTANTSTNSTTTVSDTTSTSGASGSGNEKYGTMAEFQNSENYAYAIANGVKIDSGHMMSENASAWDTYVKAGCKILKYDVTITGYSPAEAGLNFYGASGEVLNPWTQLTVAVPNSEPLGLYVKVVDADGNDSRNGEVYYANDHGVSVGRNSDGSWNLDLCCKDVATANNWGRRKGVIYVIDPNGKLDQ